MYHSLPDGRSQLENCRRERDLYQMRRFLIDAKITVRDTTLKNVVTSQMCWKVWTFVRRISSLRWKFIGSKFPVNFDENCSLSRDASELYATIIPQNKTLFFSFSWRLENEMLKFSSCYCLKLHLGWNLL